LWTNVQRGQRENRRSSIAIREMVDAVVALSEDPRPANVARYLAASRALEDSRLERPMDVDGDGRALDPARRAAA
jgi:hypothetical protein